MKLKHLSLFICLCFTLSLKVYGQVSITDSMFSGESSSAASGSKPDLTGDRTNKDSDDKQQPASTEPQKTSTPSIFSAVEPEDLPYLDPERVQAFMDRYNNLPTRSSGWCGRGTREGLELLTGEKYEGANGGSFGNNLLKTGLWRPAYSGEDYTGKLVARALPSSYGGYGHAEVIYNGLVSSDFRQRRSLIGSRSYAGNRDYVYIGKG